jgi:hypothetical protein
VVKRSRLCAGKIGPREVRVYSRPDFKGDCLSKGPGIYDYWAMNIAQEVISSFVVGPKVNFLSCREPGFVRCNSFRPGTSMPKIVDFKEGVPDNTISSFSVIP